MNLHEYQAKFLLEEYQIPTPKGQCCSTINKLPAILQELNHDKWVAKCQVHSGARGKAGGVKLLDNLAETETFFNQWLGKNIVTNQTTDTGLPVHKILIEPASKYKKELYLVCHFFFREQS